MSASITDHLHQIGKATPSFMLVSDLDHTMVQNEDHTHKHLRAFNSVWTSHFETEGVLVFSTGRSPELFRDLWLEAPLLTPDVLICSVGTEIFYVQEDARLVPDLQWRAHLDQGWDRHALQQLAAQVTELTPQAAGEQRRHKLSYQVSGGRERAAQVLALLDERVRAQGLRAKIIYSGGVDVDVLAEGAGKGKALEFLMQQMRGAGLLPRGGVQVNGDSGNDAELFEVAGVRGCVVANAHAELLEFYQRLPPGSKHVYLSRLPCSGGIVEALRHFGTLPDSEHSPAAVDTAARAALTQACALLGDASDPQLVQAAVAAPGLVVGPGAHARVLAAGTAPAAASTARPLFSWCDRVSSVSLGGGSWAVAWVQWQQAAGSGRRDLAVAALCSGVLQASEGALQLRSLHASLLGGATGTWLRT